MVTNSKEYARKYYAEHKEKYREASRRHQEKVRQQRHLENSNPRLFDMREDYKTPTTAEFKAIPQKELTYSQKYYAANRERIRAQQKESRKKKKAAEKQRAYYAANKEHLCELQRKSYARRQRRNKLSQSFFGRMRLRIEDLFSK